jgi:hypothetical protein
MSARRSISLSAAALLLLSTATPAASDPAGTGESWEVTSQMTVPGMPMQMPAQTRRVCVKPDAAPENTDPSCTNTVLSRTPSKLTWRVECTGEHAMTGLGEITYSSPSAYTGSIRFDSAEGGMTLELSGKKLGTCQAPQ